MVTPELENYIKTERAKGVSDQTIRANLLVQGGWTMSDLDEAMKPVQSVPQAPYVPVNQVQSTIAMTNESGKDGVKKVKKPIDPALLAYRKGKRNIVFALLVIFELVYYSLLFGSNLLEGWFFLILGILTAYCAATLSVKTLKPMKTPFKEALALVGVILFSLILCVLIGGALCLATCAVIGISGGF
jgi:hypothetical protein